MRKKEILSAILTEVAGMNRLLTAICTVWVSKSEWVKNLGMPQEMNEVIAEKIIDEYLAARKETQGGEGSKT